MTFDWDLAKTFLAVADEGSLSAAARALGQTQPTTSRQVAALEDALGVTLFERTGRSIAITQAGIELLDHVRAMADGASMVTLAASGQSQSVEGQVRITASELMSAYRLPSIIGELVNKAPSLEIDVVADNGIKDLVRREADIAIRHARPEQPNLWARRVRDEVMRFYASTAYLKTHGRPSKSNLSAHQIVSFAEAERMLGYLQPLAPGLKRANFRMTASSQLVALEMARSGLGMIIAPDRIGPGLSGLEHVLKEVEVFRIPTWLVTHSELRTSRRIKLVFDHLAEALS